MQSLCTLRNHCRQWPRNTRYQADATPYLGRTSTGWIAPALPGALIRSPRRRARATDFSQLGGLYHATSASALQPIRAWTSMTGSAFNGATPIAIANAIIPSIRPTERFFDG